MGYPWDKYEISLGYPWENYIYAAYMIRLCRTFDRYIYKGKTGMKNVESSGVYCKQKISFLFSLTRIYHRVYTSLCSIRLRNKSAGK
jgi:hypothetical protein